MEILPPQQNSEDYLTWTDIAMKSARDPRNVQKLDQALVDILVNDFKFSAVTKVQYAVVPLFLSNKDVCVKACTGSGKTLSFVIPLIQKMLSMQAAGELENLQNNQVLALLLSPSRELAVQTFKVIEQFKTLLEKEGSTPISMSYYIGGDKPEYDLERISTKGANILVATPGRIFDLIGKGALSFKKTEILIMDEADKLLD